MKMAIHNDLSGQLFVQAAMGNTSNYSYNGRNNTPQKRKKKVYEPFSFNDKLRREHEVIMAVADINKKLGFDEAV